MESFRFNLLKKKKKRREYFKLNQSKLTLMIIDRNVIVTQYFCLNVNIFDADNISTRTTISTKSTFDFVWVFFSSSNRLVTTIPFEIEEHFVVPFHRHRNFENYACQLCWVFRLHLYIHQCRASQYTIASYFHYNFIDKIFHRYNYNGATLYATYTRRHWHWHIYIHFGKIQHQ